MADKMLKKAEEPIVTDPEAVCETAVDGLGAMRAAIADLEEKEAILTEKLCMAKEKGLTEQAENCRSLLQRVVMHRIKKQEELREAEARQLAAELDQLTTELESQFAPEGVAVPEIEDEYDYLAKSKRMCLISKMVRTIGLIACVAGALLYLLFTQPDVLNLPFEWIYLVVVGVAAVAFVVISAIIGGSANKYKALAEQLELERLEAEEALAAQLKAEAISIERLNAASEAYEIEKQLDIKNSKPVNPVVGMINKLPVEVPEKVKNNVHKIVPVAAACTAVVAALAVSSSRKKAAEEKRSAAARRDFFKWLG